jgi:hypothetical protein
VESQGVTEPNPTTLKIKVRATLVQVGEIFGALLLLGAGYAAYEASIFFNAVYILLFVAAFQTPILFVTNVANQKIYFGLLTKPFARESARYWLASLPRLAFYASCGYLLSIAVVPCQFPNHPAYFMTTLAWALVALQLVLALMPARRISIPFTVMYAIGAAFMIWHFIQIARPAPGEKVVLDSPMQGVSCVVHGGNDPMINQHYALASQRYGVDIFKVAENVQQVRDWKIMKEDAGIGETIYSPCAGRIAFVENQEPDKEKDETGVGNFAGNYVTIEISPARYVLIAHLRYNSIKVKVGDRVKPGQPIAQFGNSGDAIRPRLYIQVQASPDFNYDTETYPIAFRRVLRGGKELQNVQAKRNDLLLLNVH